MKSLSPQEDEVIYLMQAVNLFVYLSFTTLLTQKYILRTCFKKREYEIHLVDTVTQSISFPLHFLDLMCHPLSQELWGAGVEDTVQNIYSAYGIEIKTPKFQWYLAFLLTTCPVFSGMMVSNSDWQQELLEKK